jgi:hypothetical protein
MWASDKNDASDSLSDYSQQLIAKMQARSAAAQGWSGANHLSSLFYYFTYFQRCALVMELYYWSYGVGVSILHLDLELPLEAP